MSAQDGMIAIGGLAGFICTGTGFVVIVKAMIPKRKKPELSTFWVQALDLLTLDKDNWVIPKDDVKMLFHPPTGLRLCYEGSYYRQECKAIVPGGGEVEIPHEHRQDYIKLCEKLQQIIAVRKLTTEAKPYEVEFSS